MVFFKLACHRLKGIMNQREKMRNLPCLQPIQVDSGSPAAHGILPAAFKEFNMPYDLTYELFHDKEYQLCLSQFL